MTDESIVSQMPDSTITITKEGDKLIIVRKPVLPTFRKQFFGCFMAILYVVFFTSMICGFIYSTGNEKAAVTLLFVISIISFAVILLAIRDKLRNRKSAHSPDYDVEILTFDVNQFVAQYHGMVSSFSYRFDTRLFLRYNALRIIQDTERTDVFIPCNPLDDYVSQEFYWGFYCIVGINKTDAEQILVKLKEHFETVEAFEK